MSAIAIELFSLEAEREVIGSCLLHADAVAEIAETLTVSDFLIPKHQLIYSKVLEMYKDSKPITPITTYNELQGAEVTLSDLLAYSQTSIAQKSIGAYTDIIKDFSDKRKLKTLCEEVLDDIGKGSSRAEKLSVAITENIYALAESKKKTEVMTDEEVMVLTLESLEQAIETKGEGLGMKTGWKEFDDATNGLVKGDYNIIAARPSMGKTAFALCLIDRLAGNGFKSVLFELEMGAAKLGYRRLAARSRTSLQRMYKGKVEEVELIHIMSEADKISQQSMVYTDTTAGISLMQIRNKVRKLKMTTGVDVVMIDHIGLMSPDTPSERRDLELSAISKGLRAIAKDYNVCVVALSQLNRGVEGRIDKRPRLSDLRESGSLEQDADIVIGLYRDNYYNQELDELTNTGAEELELILLKNRDGKVGPIVMEFDSRTQIVQEKTVKGK